MRKRSTEILEKLVSNDQTSLQADRLMKVYGITMKTLRTDIVEINDFLAESHLTPVRMEENGNLFFRENESEMILQAIRNMDTYSYKLSRNERQIYIMAVLLTAKDYITMQNLAKELNVSRNTILNDFGTVKDYCQVMQVNIVMKSSKGIKAEYTDAGKNHLMVELFLQMEKCFAEDSFFYQLIWQKFNMSVRLSEIKEYFRGYMEKRHVMFSDRIFSSISTWLFIYINYKTGQGKEKTEECELLNRESTSADLLSWFGNIYHIHASPADVNNFRQYIDHYHLNMDTREINDIELCGIISYFLQLLGNDIGCTIQTDTILLESLLEHIKKLKNWESYDFEMPISEELPIPKELLSKTVEKNSNVLERYLGYPLTEEMKESIMIHICAAFVRNREYLKRLKVLIVCPGNVATGKYLEAQVSNYFDFQIAGVIPGKELDTFLDYQEVDFIISTVKAKTTKVEVVKVNAQLTMNDINAIQNVAFVLGRKSTETDRQLYDKDRFFGILGNFMEKLKPEARKKFVSQVYEVMGEVLQSDSDSMIARMLDQSKIVIASEKYDWREGILKSAAILEEAECVSPEYGKKAIANVEEYGDYIVISEGIALAHAGEENGVYKDGLSLLVSPEGIRFTENNIVHLLFCFATVGDQDFLQLFREIIALGKNKKKMKEILQEKNPISIYHSLVFPTEI